MSMQTIRDGSLNDPTTSVPAVTKSMNLRTRTTNHPFENTKNAADSLPAIGGEATNGRTNVTPISKQPPERPAVETAGKVMEKATAIIRENGPRHRQLTEDECRISDK